MDPENTLKILLTTDNHVGYLEKDPIRKEDSFHSLQEVFEIAVQEQVDFILFGGDLFHDNNPSRKTLFKTMELFKNFTRGSRPCSFELLSDPLLNFGSECANYEDPNLNVSLTAFAIHGNHDDPAGEGHLSAMDILASSGFVNYFGKQSKIDEIRISPVVLKKGSTLLVLYGLGNIRDPTLHRAFLESKVTMVRHEDLSEHDAFHMLVLHQNRSQHSAKNYIPEEFLESFLDFVFWGHEHECLIDPQFNAARDFYVTQPGSSVATSLCEGESKDKHVAILSVHEKKWHLKKIPLKTVRPFVMETIDLTTVSHLAPSDTDGIRVYLHQKVEELIEKAVKAWKVKNPTVQESPLPLIRLKVEYAPGYDLSNPNRFGIAFVGKVANPRDILFFSKKRSLREKNKNGTAPVVPEIDRNRLKEEQGKVSDFVNEFLGVQKLDILPENRMHDAINLFTDKDDKDAIKDFVKVTLDRLRKKVDLEAIQISDEEDIVEKVKEEKENQFIEYEKRHGNVVQKEQAAARPSASLLDKETSKSVSTLSRSKKRKEPSSEEDQPELAQESSVQAIVIQSDSDLNEDEMMHIPESPPLPPAPKPRRKPIASSSTCTAEKKTTRKQKVTKPAVEKESKTVKKTKMDWIPSRKPKVTQLSLDDEEEEDTRSAFQSLRR